MFFELLLLFILLVSICGLTAVDYLMTLQYKRIFRTTLEFILLFLWFLFSGLVGIIGFRNKTFIVVHDEEFSYTVGETSTFRVVLVVKNASTAEKQEMLEKVVIEIRENASNEKISFLKEIVNTQAESFMRVKFSVRLSGEYSFRITNGEDEEFFSRNFLPGEIDITKTEFLRPSPIVSCTTFQDKPLHIRPKDKFENICRLTRPEVSKFEFAVYRADSDVMDNPVTDFTICSYEFHISTSGIVLRITFQRPGFFHGKVMYDGKQILHGEFDVVVISNGERAILDNILANNPSWNYHQAKLLALGNETQRGQKIYIYVSPKQLYIRDYLLKFIPLRVATFRVSSVTKIDFLFSNDNDNTYSISIHDGVQPKVVIEMDVTTARTVIAMYSHFLVRRLGGSESFAAKQKFFYDELRGLKKELRISLSIIKICREDIVGSTLSQTRHFSGKDWCKNFKVEFQGELGMDAGGPKREWLNLLCIQLFQNNPKGLFSSFSNSRLVHPNPVSQRNPSWTLKHYELAGKIVGKCLFETAAGLSFKQMVNGRFTRSFFAQVLGLRPNYKHFEQDDPELYLGKVKYILENDAESMDLTFTEDEYSPSGKLIKVVDLIPGGSKTVVTNENKEEYLNALANYRLATKVTKEIDAFMRGLHDIVPDELLTNFDENELELLWCGRSEFKVEDLQKYFVKAGWDWDPIYTRVLQWFFSVVAGLSEDEKARLLQFTTGSSLLPHGGFKELNPQFKISLSAVFGKLPTAHTCFNEICLSDNVSFENFEKCLKIAINEGSEGFAFR